MNKKAFFVQSTILFTVLLSTTLQESVIREVNLPVEQLIPSFSSLFQTKESSKDQFNLEEVCKGISLAKLSISEKEREKKQKNLGWYFSGVHKSMSDLLMNSFKPKDEQSDPPTNF